MAQRNSVAITTTVWEVLQVAASGRVCGAPSSQMSGEHKEEQKAVGLGGGQAGNTTEREIPRDRARRSLPRSFGL